MDQGFAARLTQLFVYHVGERVDYVTAPTGSGKTHAVRTWLDSAGSSVDQIWLTPPFPSALRALDLDVVRPTFVVLDDCAPTEAVVSELLRAVEHGPRALRFVLTTTTALPARVEPLVADGTVRVTTVSDLKAAYAAD